VADLAIDQDLADQEVMRHIGELGLATVEAYTTWCGAQGLSTGIQKSRSQRKKECDLALRLRSETVLSKMKNHTRRPQDTIRAIYNGQLTHEN
jgi:hypothetical protein